jgi:hypothetical protein
LDGKETFVMSLLKHFPSPNALQETTTERQAKNGNVLSFCEPDKNEKKGERV